MDYLVLVCSGMKNDRRNCNERQEGSKVDHKKGVTNIRILQGRVHLGTSCSEHR